MADEQNLEGNDPNAVAPEPEGNLVAAPVDEGGVLPLPEKNPGMKAFAAGLVFVLASIAGIFSYAWGLPVSWLLGGGLFGWGLLDGYSQRASLVSWKDRSSIWTNLLGLLRALFFVGMGARLLLQSFRHWPVLSANTLLLAGAGFLCAYLICAYAVELATRSKEILPHALLLASLALQLFAFFCFAVPFTLTWAALFSVASFGCAGFALFRGVTKGLGSLASSVALAVALLGAPLATFFVQHALLIEQQPIFQGSILLPRFFELKRDLSKGAENLAWSPANVEPDTPLASHPYSDKLAFVDEKDGKKSLTVCMRSEEGSAYSESPMNLNSDPAWWSPNSSILLATGTDAQGGMGRLNVYRWSQTKKTTGAPQTRLGRSALRGEDAMPAAAHGQLWSKDSRLFFYAAPRSLRLSGGTGIFSARVSAGSEASQPTSLSNQGWPSKVYPAVAPDSSKLLYVGEKENKKFINIGDTEENLKPRLFLFAKEPGLFPAWNKEQTHVLFVDARGLLKVMSANNKSDAVLFTRERLRSAVWKNEQGRVFTLTKAETGDVRQLWTMNLDGTGKKMIYESRCNEIFPPVWSQDSARIAFVERTGEKYSVLTLAKDGSWPRKFFVTGDKVRCLVWSQDSARLAWFADRHEGQEQELWIVEKDSMNPELAYRGEGALDKLSWSPSGQHLAFEERWSFSCLGLRLVRPDLYSVKVLDTKDGHARSVTIGGLFARQPAFSPQGTVLAFITEQNRWSLKASEKRPAALAIVRLF